jgi:hypothetical protein
MGRPHTGQPATAAGSSELSSRPAPSWAGPPYRYAQRFTRFQKPGSPSNGVGGSPLLTND